MVSILITVYLLVFLNEKQGLIIIFGLSFLGSRVSFPPRASTTLSYIVRIMATHLQAKAFVGSRGGGGTILYKTFPDFCIYFTTNMVVSAQNIQPGPSKMK